MRRKNRKNVFRKIFFKFKESRRELKKFYFKIKKIDRKKRIKIKRKLLKKKICLVMFKKTNKNFFIIVTDIKGKVITYSSAGMVSNSSNSKKKKILFF